MWLTSIRFFESTIFNPFLHEKIRIFDDKLFFVFVFQNDEVLIEAFECLISNNVIEERKFNELKDGGSCSEFLCVLTESGKSYCEVLLSKLKKKMSKIEKNKLKLQINNLIIKYPNVKLNILIAENNSSSRNSADLAAIPSVQALSVGTNCIISGYSTTSSHSIGSIICTSVTDTLVNNTNNESFSITNSAGSSDVDTNIANSDVDTNIVDAGDILVIDETAEIHDFEVESSCTIDDFFYVEREAANEIIFEEVEASCSTTANARQLLGCATDEVAGNDTTATNTECDSSNMTTIVGFSDIDNFVSNLNVRENDNERIFENEEGLPSGSCSSTVDARQFFDVVTDGVPGNYTTATNSKCDSSKITNIADFFSNFDAFDEEETHFPANENMFDVSDSTTMNLGQFSDVGTDDVSKNNNLNALEDTYQNQYTLDDFDILNNYIQTTEEDGLNIDSNSGLNLMVESVDMINNNIVEEFLNELLEKVGEVKIMKKRNRQGKVINIIKRHENDIERVDLGVQVFWKYYPLSDPNEIPNIDVHLTPVILTRYPDTSCSNIDTYEYSFVIEGRMLDAINDYIDEGYGRKDECLVYFYKYMYKQFNNVCTLKFTGNIDSKHYSKYARCYHYTCRKYKFLAKGDRLTKIHVEVFVKAGFYDPLNPRKEGPMHMLNLAFSEITGGLKRKMIQHQFSENQKAHKYLENNLMNVSMPLWESGRRDDLSSVQVRQMIHEKKSFIKRSRNDFTDASHYVSNNNDVAFIQNPLFAMVSTAEQIKIFKENCTTIHFDATGSICKKVDEAKKRIYLYALVGHHEPTKSILPVAEFLHCEHNADAIEGMFFKLRSLCRLHDIVFPFFNRICIDESGAMLLAIVRFILQFASVTAFLNYVFDILKTNPVCFEKLGLAAIVQYCRFHVARIIANDGDGMFATYSKTISDLYCNSLKAAQKIEHIDTATVFFTAFAYVFGSRKKTEKFRSSLEYLRTFRQASKEIDSKKLDKRNNEFNEY